MKLNNIFILFSRLVEQYELEVNYYAESDTGAPTTICPICQKAELNLETNILHCNCGLR